MLGVTPLGTPCPPPAPADQPKEACDLALDETFTAKERPTRGEVGPERWAQGAFGQHGFDDMNGQHASQRPDGQDQLRERLDLVNRTE